MGAGHLPGTRRSRVGGVRRRARRTDVARVGRFVAHRGEHPRKAALIPDVQRRHRYLPRAIYQLEEGEHTLKITDIQVNQLIDPIAPNVLSFVGRPRGLLVRVFTDEGGGGIAEGAGAGGLNVFRAYLGDMIKPRLVGMNPLQPRQIWETLALGTVEQATRNPSEIAGSSGPWKTEPIPSQIAGAIDIACWDIMGKAAGLPVYALLGGARRTEIPLYWSRGNGWQKSPAEMMEAVQEGYEKGYRAFKIRMDWGSYRQDADPKKDFAIFQACREWLAEEVPLGFDANSGYSVPTAIEQGRRLEALEYPTSRNLCLHTTYEGCARWLTRWIALYQPGNRKYQRGDSEI